MMEYLPASSDTSSGHVFFEQFAAHLEKISVRFYGVMAAGGRGKFQIVFAPLLFQSLAVNGLP
jgi:hypothetical protein